MIRLYPQAQITYSSALKHALRRLLKDPCVFCARSSGLTLRHYQEAVARAVVHSVERRLGRSFVVIFPRQSGKNELQAQIECYLLLRCSYSDAEMVKISPTWKPQSLNAMRRLERVLERNWLTRGRWKKENGYIYRLGRARIFFLSGNPEANIVGATANRLLEVDEAQDVLCRKYDKEIAPMAASTNATRVFWGTAWTANTLLGREMPAAQAAEKIDGHQRVFRINADVVAAEVPAYGQFVAQQVARLGREHPMVRTQFYSEEIDALGGMFPADRLALMRGAHPPLESPRVGEIYALLIDFAGEDENAREGGWDAEQLANPARDATALTVVEIDRSGLEDVILRALRYRCVYRKEWRGDKHTRLFGELRALVEHWQARYVVTDATGVGASLTSFLDRAFPGKVIPFVFNRSTKSKLGWDFLALVDRGGWQEYQVPGGHPQSAAQRAFFRQLAFTQYEILPGSEKRMRWGVPDGSRDPENGDWLHDDWVLSAALVTCLNECSFTFNSGTPAWIEAGDPLAELDQGF